MNALMLGFALFGTLSAQADCGEASISRDAVVASVLNSSNLGGVLATTPALSKRELVQINIHQTPPGQDFNVVLHYGKAGVLGVCSVAIKASVETLELNTGGEAPPACVPTVSIKAIQTNCRAESR